MGNSPSSTQLARRNYESTLDISKPSGISRRASAQGRNRAPSSRISNNMLAPPASEHRRSRSANPSTRASDFLPPPPPYSPNPPIDHPPPPPPKVTEPEEEKDFLQSGSSHTTILSFPEPSSSRSATYLQTPMRKQTAEDALETLRKYDTILIVDDSSSMIGELWREATVTLAALAEKAGEYDTDGIDIYFLNSPEVGCNLKTSRDVQALFRKVRPRGATPIGAKLEDLLRSYMYEIESVNQGDPRALKRIKPVNFIIITDGAPTDDPESVIIHTARRLDAGNFPVTQVGIQFVQIGNSRTATEYLRELDDGLSAVHNIRDIVDTTPYIGQLNGDALIKILLGGINRRVDTRGASAISGFV